MSQNFLETLKSKLPVMTFALTQAKHKRNNWGLFGAMFIPILQYVFLLYFTDQDFSGGEFHIWYYRIYFRVILFFLISLIALLVGTGMFRDLIADDTVVYLFTKPIKRHRIYFEMYAAYIIISFLIVTPGLILYHVTGDLLARTYDSTFSISYIESTYNLFLEIGGAYIVLLGLGAIFVTTGLGLKRPLLINLLIAFGIIVEQFLLDLIADNFEPVYIAYNIVAKSVIGFSSNPQVDDALFRFSLGINYEPVNTFLNFIGVLVSTLIIGYFVAKRKEFK